MSAADVLTSVRTALETIAESLERTPFTIPGPCRDEGNLARIAVVDTVRKYLLHRLREPDTPLVAAVVGLTGVGKSAILNSLAQDRISPTGSVRPTTTHGVLWAHRDHAARYWTEFVGRVTEQIGPNTDVVIGDDPLTKHLTFVDTPPLELSPHATGTTAADAVMFADLCIFVTSVARYADAAPLALLEAARARGIPTLFVMNRLPRDASARAAVVSDFADKLVAAGLLPAPDPSFIFTIEDAEGLRWHGGMAIDSVRSLRAELSELSDPEFREVVIDETAEATMLAVADRADLVATLLRSQENHRRGLLAMVDRAYQAAGDRLTQTIGAGDLRSVASRRSWSGARDDLGGSITRAAGTAAQDSARGWADEGSALLTGGFEGLRRHGAGAAAAAIEELDAWHESLAPRAVRRRRRGRRLRKRIDALWRAALDPSAAPRVWKKNGAHHIAEARADLGMAMVGALTRDAERFGRRLGPAIDEDAVAGVIAAVRYLRELPEPDLVDASSTEAVNDG